MTHKHLGLKLLQGFQYYANDDYDRGTAERNLYLSAHLIEDRNDCDKGKTCGAYDGDLVKNTLDVVGSGSAGAG